MSKSKIRWKLPFLRPVLLISATICSLTPRVRVNFFGILSAIGSRQLGQVWFSLIQVARQPEHIWCPHLSVALSIFVLPSKSSIQTGQDSDSMTLTSLGGSSGSGAGAGVEVDASGATTTSSILSGLGKRFDKMTP